MIFNTEIETESGFLDAYWLSNFFLYFLKMSTKVRYAMEQGLHTYWWHAGNDLETEGVYTDQESVELPWIPFLFDMKDHSQTLMDKIRVVVWNMRREGKLTVQDVDVGPPGRGGGRPGCLHPDGRDGGRLVGRSSHPLHIQVYLRDGLIIRKHQTY